MSDLGERGIGLASVASLLGLQPSFLSVQSLYSNPEKNLKASFYHITLLLKNLWLSTAMGTQSKSSTPYIPRRASPGSATSSPTQTWHPLSLHPGPLFPECSSFTLYRCPSCFKGQLKLSLLQKSFIRLHGLNSKYHS